MHGRKGLEKHRKLKLHMAILLGLLSEYLPLFGIFHPLKKDFKKYCNCPKSQDFVDSTLDRLISKEKQTST